MRLERRGVRVDRVLAGERQVAGRRVELRVVGDVLPHALLAPAAEVDDGRDPREAARDRLLEPLEVVAVDGEGKRGECVVRAHERVRSATVSMCGVCGNMSTGRARSSR